MGVGVAGWFLLFMSMSAQLKQCGFDGTRMRLRRTCEQIMLHDTLAFIVHDIDAKISTRTRTRTDAAAGTTITERFMSVYVAADRRLCFSPFFLLSSPNSSKGPPIDRPTDRPTNQPTNQPTNRATN